MNNELFSAFRSSVDDVIKLKTVILTAQLTLIMNLHKNHHCLELAVVSTMPSTILIKTIIYVETCYCIILTLFTLNVLFSFMNYQQSPGT